MIKTFDNIKALFFDWDNTLVDAWPVLLTATNFTRNHFGLSPVSLDDLKILARSSTRESFPKNFGEKWQLAQDLFYSQVQNNAHLLQIFPQTKNFLKSVNKKNLKTALISNKLNTLLKKEVAEFNLHFDIILGSGDAPFDKPAKNMGSIALEKLNLQPHEVIYIGDSITDWQFAENLGMLTIAIGNEKFTGPILARFNTHVEAFSFLESNLKSL